MLVQLRRVVCLLVLMQCCLSVVRATGGGTGHSPGDPSGIDDITKLEEELDALEVGARRLPDELDGDGRALDVAVGRAKEYLSSASVAVNEAKDLIQKVKAGTLHGETAGGGNKTKGLRETAEKARKAVAEAEEEVNYMNAKQDYAVKKEKEGAYVMEELDNAIKKYMKVPVGSRKNEILLDASQAGLGALRRSLEGLRKSINETTPRKAEVNAELESLKQSLKQFEEGIKNMPPPQTTVQQEGERTNAVETPGQNTAEGGVTPPIPTENLEKRPQSESAGVNTTITRNGNAGEQQSQGERVGNNQSTTQNNATPKEPEGNENTEKPGNDIPNKQNETHSDKNEEQSEKGKPNETGDSQKPTTPSNTAPDTVNTGSGGVMSGSHSSSSGTMHFNVSGLSDGSSSPALVHSPLLLLTLLCVLGCSLVC